MSLRLETVLKLLREKWRFQTIHFGVVWTRRLIVTFQRRFQTAPA